jgi:hypothetical protein
VAPVPGNPLEGLCFFLPINTAIAPPAAGQINGQAREPGDAACAKNKAPTAQPNATSSLVRQ